MITVEEQRLREQLAIDEITFAIPAQSFAIACAISAEEALPVVTEFALRIAFVCGNLSPIQIQEFFGFSKKETDAVIKALLGERLIQWSEDQLELTPYALARFQDSSDNLPRFFKIQDWSAEVVFDLISFNPANRPDRIKRVRSQVELATRNFDKQSRTIQYAEQAFQQHLSQICKKEKAEIYKISAVDAGERFSIPLPCVFHLDLEGQVSVRRNIDDESFGSRLEISEAITDALANQDRGNNESLRDFIRLFDDTLLGRYVSNDAFDLRRYVQEVHLTGVANYEDARVFPMLGALHLPRNADLVLGRVATELAQLDLSTSAKEDIDQETGAPSTAAPEAAGTGVSQYRQGLWWAPQLSLWARARGARDLVQKLDRVLSSAPGCGAPPHSGIRVVVPADRRSTRERLSVYWDLFPRLFGADVSLMNGNLELLLVPDLLVCALFHFHLAHQPVAVPIGFMSSQPDHLQAAGALVSNRVRGKPELLSASRDDGGGEAVQELTLLLDGLGTRGLTPTPSGRARLTLRKPV
ncbi:hypothetical protein ACQKRQ_02390 [Paraburkholderia sp. NPDC080076]|uniref:hypothetical protein n=1 Tax=Paraburkholderia sp. NPDC080076 TaxID=3390605 RepID=UPI003CFEAAC0